MKVWSPIFNLIAVMLIAVILTIFNRIDEVNRRQFEEVRLSYAIDYATEAAFRTAIDTDSIDTDYAGTGLEEVRVNPIFVLDTLCNLLCFSYDMSPGQENFDTIKNSIVTAVLFTVDGYYVLETTEVDNTPKDSIIGMESGLVWGLKRPYLYYTDSGRLFAVNLVSEATIEYIPRDEQNIGGEVEGEPSSLIYRKKLSDNDVYHKRNVLEGKTVEEVKMKMKQSISNLVTEDINFAIHARNLASIYKVTKSFYMPTTDSLTAVNDIESPSLLVFFQDSSFLNGYNLDVTAVGGTRVKVRSNIIGFTVDGKDGYFYCYAGQQLGETGIHITKRFDTMHEAAMAGYSPHFGFLSKPFGKGVVILS